MEMDQSTFIAENVITYKREFHFSSLIYSVDFIPFLILLTHWISTQRSDRCQFKNFHSISIVFSPHFHFNFDEKILGTRLELK